SALRLDYVPHFPGLTTQSLNRHPPRSLATTKGHLDQERKNLRSTKEPTIIQPDASEPASYLDEPFPAQAPVRSNACYVHIVNPIEATGQIFSDQTGRFIAPSTTGNNDMMILHDYDSNYIFAQPFRNCTTQCILAAFKELHQRLLQAGLLPQLHPLDNECSTILKDYLRNSNIDFQLVPPGLHRRNAAECAIRTFQNRFIAGLCTTNPNFPIALWDKLILQSEITLNPLRGSCINPKLSAYAQIHGAFNFNRTPLGPSPDPAPLLRVPATTPPPGNPLPTAAPNITPLDDAPAPPLAPPSSPTNIIPPDTDEDPPPTPFS
ncbi:MAG: hypothetical protein SGBAC_003109, partial [Bacillariaceae sp.]